MKQKEIAHLNQERRNMPAMPRPEGKAKKIADSILGNPKKESKRKAKKPLEYSDKLSR
jgi:hypothetical protein